MTELQKEAKKLRDHPASKDFFRAADEEYKTLVNALKAIKPEDLRHLQGKVTILSQITNQE